MYQIPNSPTAVPNAQVQIHQRLSGGNSLRRTSRTTSAIAQAAVMTAVTSWSLASSGGGAGRRVLLT